MEQGWGLAAGFSVSFCFRFLVSCFWFLSSLLPSTRGCEFLVSFILLPFTSGCEFSGLLYLFFVPLTFFLFLLSLLSLLLLMWLGRVAFSGLGVCLDCTCFLCCQSFPTCHKFF